MKRWLALIILIASTLCMGQSTKFDMQSQLKQWSNSSPAHKGVIPIWDDTSSTYIPGDPFVSPNIVWPVVQKTSNTSSGSVASLAKAFASNNIAGNTIVIVCGVGNGTTPTISDTGTNSYTRAVGVANGSAFNVNIFFATNVVAGANTVTVNNGGTTASIAMEIYELPPGIIVPGSNATDTTATGTGTGTALSSGILTTNYPNEFVFAAFGVGTAAQTITVGGGFTNDSGQLNPTTPAGLFSFVSASQFAGVVANFTATATITSEPWAAVQVAFKPVIFQVGGTTYSPPIATPLSGAGCTPTHLLSAATTNSTSVKGSAGQLYNVVVTNTNASPRYLKFYDTASAPTCNSSTVVQTYVIPGNSSGGGMVVPIPVGMAFINGIGFCITGAIADNDNTAVAANEVVVNACYK